MNKNNYVLFDFDGTIANTYPVIVEILNQIAPEYGTKQLSITEYQKLRHEHMLGAVRALGVSWYQLPFFLNRVRNELFERLDDVGMFPGMSDVIRELTDSGFSLGIVTANTKKNVDYFLLRQNIAPFFHFTRATSFFFGKTGTIKNICRGFQLNPETTWYIGDEVRDVEAAQACGLRNIAVSWGVNDRSLLTEAGPDLLIDEPIEIVKQLI